MFKIDKALNENINLWSYDYEKDKIKFNYADEIMEAYQDLFKNIFPNINTDPSTPQGQIITSLTQTDLSTISFLENLGNAFFLGGNGNFLDLWSWNLFRLERKQGAPSEVLINIQGVPHTQIDKDFKVTDGEHEFIISKPYTIGDNGNVEALFYANNISDFVAPANSINEIITIIDGVERINNENQATPAILKETDSQLFNRCLKFGSAFKNASFRSILANVFQVEGTKKVTGAENTGDNPATFNGVEIAGHSIYIVAYGGSDYDIANAIFQSRATGCGMVGNVSVNIEYNKQTYNFKFNRPDKVILKAEVTLSPSHQPPANFESLIKDNLAEYINNLDIGAYITQPSLSENIYKKLQGFYVKDVKFGLKSGDVGYEPIQLKLNQMALIQKTDIRVSVE